MLNQTSHEYHIHDLGTLHLLPDIPDKSVDMILTDLPYGTTRNKWDSVISLPDLWAEYNRIIKNNGAIVLTAQNMFTAQLMRSNARFYRYSLVWDKVLKTGFLNANRMPLRQHEDICIFYKKLPTYNPQKSTGSPNHGTGSTTIPTNNNYGSMECRDNSKTLGTEKHPSSIISIPKPHPSTTIHPTQKPLALAEYLIKTYTNEGGTVHDSCMGSGWCMEACINLNRIFIGHEMYDTWEWHYKELLARKTYDPVQNNSSRSPMA